MRSNLQDRIARRLKAIREKRGLTRDEVSRQMGLDPDALAALESGERRISPEELARAAEIFDVDVGNFTDPFRLGEGEAQWTFRVRRA